MQSDDCFTGTCGRCRSCAAKATDRQDDLPPDTRRCPSHDGSTLHGCEHCRAEGEKAATERIAALLESPWWKAVEDEWMQSSGTTRGEIAAEWLRGKVPQGELEPNDA
jgi:hypothetical protein